ncbi:MAG: glycosyltransferase family 4 protein [Ferruginibacter sp.]
MKILHVLYSGLGGHGNVFFSFVKGTGKNEFLYEALFNGIEAVKPDYINICHEYAIPWNFVPKRPGLDLRYYLNLVKNIKNSDADIVFLHSSAYIMPAWLGSVFSKKKKKIIVRETQANHLKVKMEWVWLFVAMLMADAIVFLSEAYRLEIAKKLSLVYRSKKIFVIPNGLDLDLYKPVNNNNSGELIIGMQSRLVRIKDHLTLLEAFSLLIKKDAYRQNQYLLKIAGDGDYSQALQAKSESLGLNNVVEFTGMLPENELLQFLHTLDIYVHASLGETMSTAIMQAMACGLPVIASDVRGINNMISHGTNGILVPAKNPAAMCAAIELLINSAGKRKELSIAARRCAEEKFSNASMVNAYRKLFLN